MWPFAKKKEFSEPVKTILEGIFKGEWDESYSIKHPEYHIWAHNTDRTLELKISCSSCYCHWMTDEESKAVAKKFDEFKRAKYNAEQSIRNRAERERFMQLVENK